jgi:GAF domain-containing protein
MSLELPKGSFEKTSQQLPAYLTKAAFSKQSPRVPLGGKSFGPRPSPRRELAPLHDVGTVLPDGHSIATTAFMQANQVCDFMAYHLPDESTQLAWLQGCMTLVKLLSAIPSDLSEAGCIRRALHASRVLLRCTHSELFIVDAATRQLRRFRSEPAEGSSPIFEPPFSFENGVVGLVAETGKCLRLIDVTHHQRYANDVDLCVREQATPRIRAESAPVMYMPVKDSAAKVVAVIGVAGRRAGRADGFSDSDELLLSMVSVQVSVALRLIQQTRAMENQRRKAQVVAEASKVVFADLSMNALFTEAPRFAMSLVPCSDAQLLVVDHKDAVIWTLKKANDEQAAEQTTSYSMKTMQNIALTQAVQSGKALSVNDTSADPRYSMFAEHFETMARSMLVCPIKFNGTTTSLLLMTDHSVGHFAPKADRTLQPLLDSIALALHNTQIHMASLRFTSCLHDLSTVLSTDQLIDRVKEIVKQVVLANEVSVFLVDHERKQMWLGDIAVGEHIHKLPFEQGLVGAAAQHAQQLDILDPCSDARYDAQVDGFSDHDLHPEVLLVLPIKNKAGRLLSLLKVLRVDRVAFTQQDMAVLSVLARHLGIMQSLCLEHAVVRHGLLSYQAQFEFVQSISSQLDFNTLMKMLIESITSIFNAEHCVVFLLQHDAEKMTAHYVEHGELIEKRLRTKGVAARVLYTGSMVRINSIETDERYEADVDEQLGLEARNLMLMPITSRRAKKTIGALQLMNKKGSMSWDDADSNTFSNIVRQVGIAIENAEQLSQVNQFQTMHERTVGRLQMANQLLVTVMATLDYATLIPVILQNIVSLMDCSTAMLYMYDRDSDELVLRLAEGKGHRFQNGHGLVGRAAKNKEVVNVRHCQADTQFAPDIDQRPGQRTSCLLAVPIAVPDTSELLAVLVAVNKHKIKEDAATEQTSAAEKERRSSGFFDTFDISILQQYGLGCAVAIRNIDAFTKSMSAFGFIRTMSSHLGLDAAIDKIIESTCHYLECDRASLFVVDQKKRELWSRPTGLASELKKVIRVPIGLGIAGTVADTGQTINIPDAYKDKRFSQDVDKRTGYHTKSILCMSVTDEFGDIVAVIQAINKKTGIFQREDEIFLRAFAGTAAVVLRNAKRFEAAGESRNRLSCLITDFIELRCCVLFALHHLHDTVAPWFYADFCKESAAAPLLIYRCCVSG